MHCHEPLTPLLPPLYIAYALRGGIALLFVLGAALGRTFEAESARAIELWVVLSTAILLFFYLAVMMNAGVTTAESIRQLVRGRISVAFYGGAVLVGLVVPVAVGLAGYFSPPPTGLLAVVGLASLVGDFYVKYSISKAGIYVPLTGTFPARAR